MKAVNVDDVLRILYKYRGYVFVTDEIRYSDMVDEIVNLKSLKQELILDKIYADIQKLRGCSCGCSDGIIDDVEDIIDKYRGVEDEISN